MRQAIYFVIAAATLVAAGCDQTLEPEIGEASREPVEERTEADAAEAGPEEGVERGGDISVELATWEEIQTWKDAQRGKVVVIDVWSTFCLTCMREFPSFVELHNEFGDSIACASLSVDYYGGEGNRPEDVVPKVTKFLEAKNATMKNFVSRDPDSVVLAHLDTAGIPAAVVYDREGKLRKVFNNDGDEFEPGGFHYEEHVAPLVAELVAAGTLARRDTSTQGH